MILIKILIILAILYFAGTATIGLLIFNSWGGGSMKNKDRNRVILYYAISIVLIIINTFCL